MKSSIVIATASAPLHAANIGSTAFLLPIGRKTPPIVFPPRMMNRAMLRRPSRHSTVTLLARFRGLSMSAPRAFAL